MEKLRIDAETRAALFHPKHEFFRSKQSRDPPFPRFTSKESCAIITLVTKNGNVFNNIGNAGKFDPDRSKLFASLFLSNSGMPGLRLQPASTSRVKTLPTSFIDIAEDCSELKMNGSPSPEIVHQFLETALLVVLWEAHSIFALRDIQACEELGIFTPRAAHWQSVALPRDRHQVARVKITADYRLAIQG